MAPIERMMAEALVQYRANEVEVQRWYDLISACSPDVVPDVSGIPVTVRPLVAERLSRDAYEQRHKKPKEMLRLASLAIQIADGGEGPTARDAMVTAWAYRMNARRILGDLVAADCDAAVVTAEYPKATDLAVQARACSMVASLRHCQDRAETARQLLKTASWLYRRVGDDVGVAQIAVQLAILENREHNPATAFRILTSVVQRVPELPEELSIIATHNLVGTLVDLEEYESAAQLMAQWRNVIRERAAPVQFARLRWRQGQVRLAMGDPYAAEPLLEAARDFFLREDRMMELTSINLDLGVLALETGEVNCALHRFGRARKLASDLGLEREAIAAELAISKVAPASILTIWELVAEVSGLPRRRRSPAERASA